MKILKSIATGLGAVALTAVLANLVYMIVVRIVWRNVPEVMVRWGPDVWVAIRSSPAFWLAAGLAFAVAFRLTYCPQTSRRAAGATPLIVRRYSDYGTALRPPPRQ